MRKILILEDDRMLTKLYQDKLTKEGFEVQVAYDGQEGLNKQKSFSPDLVILDILMPVLDGFEFLERIKNDPAGRDIPIIVCSNLSQDFDIKKALELGAKDFYNKADVSLQELIKKVKEYIG